MKVTVQDVEIFNLIEPEKLKDYLQSHSFKLDRPFMDNATIWLKQEPEQGESGLALSRCVILQLFLV